MGLTVKSDETHIFPVMDCINCGRPMTPFGFSELINDEESGIPLPYCLSCHQVSKVRPEKSAKWADMLWMEKKEWNLEL